MPPLCSTPSALPPTLPIPPHLPPPSPCQASTSWTTRPTPSSRASLWRTTTTRTLGTWSPGTASTSTARPAATCSSARARRCGAGLGGAAALRCGAALRGSRAALSRAMMVGSAVAAAHGHGAGAAPDPLLNSLLTLVLPPPPHSLSPSLPPSQAHFHIDNKQGFSDIGMAHPAAVAPQEARGFVCLASARAARKVTLQVRGAARAAQRSTAHTTPRWLAMLRHAMPAAAQSRLGAALAPARSWPPALTPPSRLPSPCPCAARRRVGGRDGAHGARSLLGPPRLGAGAARRRAHPRAGVRGVVNVQGGRPGRGRVHMRLRAGRPACVGSLPRAAPGAHACCDAGGTARQPAVWCAACSRRLLTRCPSLPPFLSPFRRPRCCLGGAAGATPTRCSTWMPTCEGGGHVKSSSPQPAATVRRRRLNPGAALLVARHRPSQPPSAAAPLTSVCYQ